MPSFGRSPKRGMVRQDEEVNRNNKTQRSGSAHVRCERGKGKWKDRDKQQWGGCVYRAVDE